MRLRRVRAGVYLSPDGRWRIWRHVGDRDDPPSWVATSAAEEIDQRFPTLAEARAWLERRLTTD